MLKLKDMRDRNFYITVFVYSLIIGGYSARLFAIAGKSVEANLIKVTILLAFSPSLLSILFSQKAVQAMNRAFIGSVLFAYVYSIVFGVFSQIENPSSNIVEIISMIFFSSFLGLFWVFGVVIGAIGIVVSGLIFGIKQMLSKPD